MSDLAKLARVLAEKRQTLAEGVMSRGHETKEYLIAVGAYRTLTTVIQLIEDTQAAGIEVEEDKVEAAFTEPEPAPRKLTKQRPRSWGGR